MPRNWSERIITCRWAVLGFVALLTLVCGILATRVRFDNSIEIWFLENDPELVGYNRFAECFGGDEFVVIGVAADDVFSRPVLESVERLTRMAAAKPHVIAVRSLTSVAFPGGLAALPPDDAPLHAARGRILASAVARGWLVSPAAMTTAVLVEMDRKGNTVEGKNAMVGALREGVAEERGRSPGIRFFMAGTPVLDEAFFRYNNRDLTLLFPLSIALILLVGIMAFRRPGAALLQLTAVAISVVWVFGLMGLLGLKMSVLSTVLPPLLLAIGVANSVHVISDTYRRIGVGIPRNQAISESIAHLLKPCAFTSLTTVAGLLSLLVSPMRPVREFGALAAVGVVFAFLLSLVFLPAMLALLRAPKPESAKRLATGWLPAILAWCDRCSQTRPRLILLAGALLLAGSVIATSRLKVGIYALDWFTNNDPVTTDLRLADHDLGGSCTLEFLVSAPNGGLADPKILGRLHQFERWLEREIPGITRAISIADVQQEMPAISSQIQSFTLAFAVITLLMIILLGSWKLGLLAMIPNVLPVAMGLGTMAVAGIGLSPGTIMIGAIALGLVVDDTVHFLVSLRRELTRDPDLDAAITATFITCGRPIILTSVILMAGFAVMMVGSFNPSIQFGAVSALVIGYALMADLLLLPAALRVMRPNVAF
jgi:hypothetical protein